MRRSLSLAAVSLLAAVPVSAQTTTSVLGLRTLLPAHVLCTDLPVAALPSVTLSVSGGHNPDGRTSLVRGDDLVVAGGSSTGLAVGQRFVARRLQGSVKDFPRKGEGFGAVHTTGVIALTAVDGQTAIARITLSCDPIEPGDYLEPYVEPTLPVTADAMAAPQFDDRAAVLFGVDRRESLGDGDVVSIDRGTAQGVVAGARFAIYRDRHDGLPLVHIGEAVVVEPIEATSKVVVVTAKDAVRAGDVVIPRRAAP